MVLPHPHADQESQLQPAASASVAPAAPLPGVSQAALSCEQLAATLSGASPGGVRGPLLIDTRPARQFRRAHVRGSHHIPAARLVSSEPPDGDLILISEGSDQARRLIEALHSGGYSRRIRYLQEGFAGWQRRQLPIAPAQRLSRHGQLAARRSPLTLLLAGLGLPLLAAAALIPSLPLLGFGLALLLGAWIEADPLERLPSRQLEADG